MYAQVKYAQEYRKAVLVGILSPVTSTGRVLGVSAKAGIRVCAKLPIATEAGSLEERFFVPAASALPAGNNQPSFLPFFLHPRTILEHYPDLVEMVIFSFTFTTLNCF